MIAFLVTMYFRNNSIYLLRFWEFVHDSFFSIIDVQESSY